MAFGFGGLGSGFRDSGFGFRVRVRISGFGVTPPGGAGDLGAEACLGWERVHQERGGEEQILALCAPGVQGLVFV